MEKIFDRCYGSILGSLIGDSLGARYEFNPNYKEQIKTDMKNNFLDILGGGIWNLLKGQFTDDSELTLTLVKSLIEAKTINQDIIAKNYNLWYNSNPFDIGITTKKCFSKKICDEMILSAKQIDIESLNKYNDNNLSNGFLMRITPIAIYISGYIYKIKIINDIQFNKIKELIRLDTSLTHSSNQALDYAICYVFLIAYNILDGNSNRGKELLTYYLDGSDALKIFNNGINYNSKLVHDPNVLIGDVKIAFQLAVRKSYFNFTFEEAIISTVNLGGDTDTNCCIVGGLVGSKLGSNIINKQWKNTVEKLKCDRYNKLGINNIVNNLENISKELFRLGFSYI